MDPERLPLTPDESTQSLGLGKIKERGLVIAVVGPVFVDKLEEHTSLSSSDGSPSLLWEGDSSLGLEDLLTESMILSLSAACCLCRL